ncbi:hypothetical protein SKAU_G00131650 [Synaphobranchus kaupii]|uniref:Uncharacterized protein n=1 Tax=Synaphobranchus kaupii TaxID=118154 RepID=A0A9Q1FQY0_SYNKA|nr:hypothetical protein SKAU_G00131650 [Synaphobranchus kaupii]
MRDTVQYRAQWIRANSSKNKLEVLHEFPRLTTSGMITQDFLVLHGEAAPKLFETWLTVYAEKILHLARREGKFPFPVEEMTLDAKGEIALRLLPIMLPPPVFRVGRKVVRPSVDEARQAFIGLRPIIGWNKHGGVPPTG